MGHTAVVEELVKVAGIAINQEDVSLLYESCSMEIVINLYPNPCVSLTEKWFHTSVDSFVEWSHVSGEGANQRPSRQHQPSEYGK